MSDSTHIFAPDMPTTRQRSNDAIQKKTLPYTKGTAINGTTINGATINGLTNGITANCATGVAHLQPRPLHPPRHFVQPQPLVIPTTSDSQAEAIRTHTYWSGFYKKTIKERRTQLGLAFPYLAKPSSLENFASAQTSAKTSGQSTPNLGQPMHRSLTMTSILPSMSSPLSSTSTSNTTTTTAKSFEALSSIDSRPNSPNVPGATTDVNSDQLGEKTLLDFTDDDKDEQANGSTQQQQQQQEQQQEQEQKDPLFDQEDEVMTEEERREQLEKERKATVISDLTEQRRMIGSPNGRLLEGDLSLDARLDAIIATEQEGTPFPVHGLDEQIANNMIENCIGTLGLPMGLAFNFTINGSPLVVPMAIEEPSVIAAVSSAAKTISSYKGFQAWAPERNMVVAQVQLLDIADGDMDQVVQQMQDQESSIRDEANEYCTNMVLRGGGVQRVTLHRIRRRSNREGFQGQDLLIKHGVISPHKVPKREHGEGNTGHCSEWLVVHLHIDVGDAMGANCANTVAEGIAPYLAKLSGGRAGVRILSNLNVDRIAKSTFRLPFSHMGYKSLPGKDVAVRILEAYEWADLDPYRAATHNKGIMNGIDAVALATGQDWRAIEAGAHAWASGAGSLSERSSMSSSGLSPPTPSSLSGTGSKRKFEGDEDETRIYRGDAYKSLTRYWIEEDEERMRQGFKGQDALVFCGELEMPIMVGTKGGVLSTNPVHAFSLGVMKYPDSKQLAIAMVTTGLTQNFAALRALVTEGIQRGHMALHARNIAISAGTPPVSVDEVTAYMIDTGKIHLGAARSYIAARGLRIHSQASSLSSSSSSTSDDQPST
ncbi:hypothetical protein BGZ59_003975 [Podila verticillata]|nr:hypothetical protein BGZ59_003975 [Podila verticillata]